MECGGRGYIVLDDAKLVEGVVDGGNRVGVLAGELGIPLGFIALPVLYYLLLSTLHIPGADGVGVGVPVDNDVSICPHPPLLLRNFSSLLHFARLFENHTCNVRSSSLLCYLFCHPSVLSSLCLFCLIKMNDSLSLPMFTVCVCEYYCSSVSRPLSK